MKETKKGTGNDYGYRHEMKMEKGFFKKQTYQQNKRLRLLRQLYQKGFFFDNLDNVNLK